ncbi:MAG: MarR family transcriptional regulator [Acidimicrobiia bacterium]|nr:MarR family transcriptional regulator [Acidimicrobiia bacterium]
MTNEQQPDPTKEKPDNTKALLRFVERFAMILAESGMDRMPARVFAYILAEDSDRYTAAELAEGLGVSRAAISGATRALVDGGFIDKGREPGSRVDHFMVYDDDVWAAIAQQRTPLLSRYQTVVDEGVDLIGVDTRGGRRLLQTEAYFDFMMEALPKIVDEWHSRKNDLVEEAAQRHRSRLTDV